MVGFKKTAFVGDKTTDMHDKRHPRNKALEGKLKYNLISNNLKALKAIIPGKNAKRGVSFHTF
jgi:hypothetical protein